MKYHVSELIDVDKIHKLMESFYALTGIPSTLTDLDGTVLKTSGGEMLGAGWKRVCLDFHRKTPESHSMCVESDTVLSSQAINNTACPIYKCHNGIMDAAIPIYIEGQHIVNLFSGQFLLEPPDINYFRKQAARYNYDEDSYIKAVNEVPVLGEQYVQQGLEFLKDLAQLITLMGFKEKQLISYKNELESRVESRTAELKNALDEIKTLRGIIPICSYCKKIRDDEGAWEAFEAYISKHSDAVFSHGACPECCEKILHETE